MNNEESLFNDLKPMKTKWARCIKNTGNEISLTVGDSYIVEAPHENDIPGRIRIIDNTEDSYLFPASWFEIYWE